MSLGRAFGSRSTSRQFSAASQLYGSSITRPWVVFRQARRSATGGTALRSKTAFSIFFSILSVS